MKRFSMVALMLRRSSQVRMARSLLILGALTLVATVTSALLNLYSDVDAKLHREFRRFGANVVIIGNGNALPLEEVRHAARASDTVVPYAYAIAKDQTGRPIVVVGTDVMLAHKVNPAWHIDGSLDAEGILIGKRVAEQIGTQGIRLTFGTKVYSVANASVISTGGPEDSRVYMPLSAFTTWTGVSASVLELSIPGSAEEVDAEIRRLQQTFSTLDVRPVRQLREAETRVLDRTRSILLATSVLIAVVVILCVLATLSSSILERRRDFALMKALGCSNQAIALLFIGEACAIATLGAVLGFSIGAALSSVMGRINFDVPLDVRVETFPIVLAGSLLIALLGASLPLARLRRIQPAVMLKGE
jgi:putative ABC transport system permease protein